MSYTRYVAGGLVVIGIGHYIADGVAHPDGTGDVPSPNRASVVVASTATGGIEGPVTVQAMTGKLLSILPAPDMRWPNVTMLSS